MSKNKVQSDKFDLDAGSMVDLLASNDGELKCGKSWAPTLRDLVAVLCDELEQMGHAPALAFKSAQRLVLRQSHYMGGRQYYLPGAARLKKAVRDIEIHHKFNGSNINQLVDDFQLTPQQIYSVLREQRELWQGRKKLQLA